MVACSADADGEGAVGELGKWLGLAWVLGAVGCAGPDVDALPYACESSAECGPGWVCGPQRRCVPRDQADVVDTSVCSEDALRCEAGQPERCVAGAWVAEAPCPSDRPRCAEGLCLAGCVEGDGRCEGRERFECDAEGVFQSLGECQNACVDGQCAGVCRPDEVRCDERYVSTCTALGQWQRAEVACPAACVDGACEGECVPMQRRCVEGGDGALTVPERCGEDGLWHAEPECPYACVAGVCTGTCWPGEIGCDGAEALSCSEEGLPVTETVCPEVCSFGSCGGPCTDGAVQCRGLGGLGVRQTCEGGAWVDGEACPHLCVDGGCVGECRPGSVSCREGLPVSCSRDGEWVDGEPCAFACVDGGCGGICRPEERRCSGDVLEVCGARGEWEALVTCAAGCEVEGCVACDHDDPVVLCEGRCGVLNDACGTPVDCGGCEGPGETCGGGGVEGVCGCTPDAPEVSCAGKCGNVLSNCGQLITCTTALGGVECASPTLCGAGDAGLGNCCVPETAEEACAGRCGLVADNCGQVLNCGDDCAETAGYLCGAAEPSYCGCVPGTARCDGRVPEVCDDAGRWVSGETCAFSCSLGECGGACSSGAQECNLEVPRVCIDGEWFDEPSCTSQSQTCQGGVCVGECAAGKARCGGEGALAGRVPESCDWQGQWVTGEACVGSTCVGGVCVGVCEPGQRRCRQGPVDVLERCGPLGQWEVESACPYVCEENGGARCAGECVPGSAARCDGSKIEICPDGYWVELLACAEECVGGGCCQTTASVCTGDPGAPCGGAAIKDCGLSVTCGEGCDSGYTCGAAVSGRCGCKPGARRCRGATVQECAGDGLAWVDVQGCGTGEVCVEALGACATCEPGARRCVGNRAEVCGTSGQWPTSEGQDCGATSQTCVGGSCVGICAPGQISCVDLTSYKGCVDGAFIGATASCGQVEPDFYCMDENPDVCACFEGSTRCGGDGKSIEQCVGGRWETSTTCAANRTCCEACGPACMTDFQCTQCELR